MSTPGKVLIVLIALSLLGWIVLFSMISEYNRNWGALLQQKTEEAAKLEQQKQTSLAEVEKLKTAISDEQIALRQDRALLRTQISGAERALSDTKETQQRATHQLAQTNTALADAQAAVERRNREVADLTRQKDQAMGEVAQLKSEVGGLMDQLEQLRSGFQSTLSENRSLLERLARSGATSSRRTSERAALRPTISLIP